MNMKGKALLAGCIALVMSSAALAEDIKIAVVGAMSGPVAQYGDQEFTGAEQAVADINAKGGIKGNKLQIVKYDDACDPKQAVAVANKVVNDGIKYVIGHLCSSSTQPASDIYEDEGILMITPAATAPELTARGYKLILRTTHAMKLTDDGERCYRHARQLVDAWLALEDDLRIADDRPVGVLRVRAPHAFGQQQLLAPLVAFLQRHPQLSVEWMLNDNTVDFLSDNIDCAIRVGAEVDPATVSVLLAEVPRCVVASPELLAKYPPLTSLEALSGLPWIAINTFYQHEVRLRHQASGQIVSTAITPCLSTDSLYVARNTALAGLGVAMVSSWTVVEDIAAGRLIELFPQWRPASLPVHLVYPWARYYPTRLRKFLDLMREIMPDLAGMQRPQSA